ncbi:MAG: histidine kinase [Lachnospiraceae bacterium]|nr:histidine kinase [Lachnospiraceae bacterium]
MRETVRNHYFVVGKFIGLVLLLGYEIIKNKGDFMIRAYLGMWFSFFVLAAVLFEITENKKIQIIEIIIEGILTGIGVFLFPVSGCMVGVLWIADVCTLRKMKGSGYFLCLIMLIPYCRVVENPLNGILFAIFVITVYFQERVIINQYRSDIGMEEEVQLELKTDIEKQKDFHRQELKKSRLKFENQMLEDRNRISQALHDKLGHSINGSIYQLEAARLLVQKKPGECEKILQIVIDQLRLSMDEIRAILRSERPDKQRIASLALQSLCEECESQYNIHTELNISDAEENIPESIWEIILDNTYEAVTNALKYANCHCIYIDIIVMNKVVRCTIRDDGKGAMNIEEGMGIAGMKNRVRSVKGYIDIESEAGFTINMILPL